MSGPLRVDAGQLRAFCARVLEQCGVPPVHGALVADVLVCADLRGVESHGVARLTTSVTRIQRGLVNLAPNLRLVVDDGPAAVLDGDNGLGPVVTVRAMEEAVGRAARYGVGVVAARNSNHFGAAAYYTRPALERRMIAVVLSNAPSALPPWGGRSAFFGTNPICVAVPARSRPIVLDMGVGTVSRGRLLLAARRGESIPAGWAIGPSGEPTTDPAEALRGAILPFGGYKGAGLTLIVEILTSILTGGEFGPHLVSLYEEPGRPQGLGHLLVCLDVRRFLSVEEFDARLGAMIEEIRAVPHMPGTDRIFLPGELEAETELERERGGIPLPSETVEDLRRVAAAVGIEFTLSGQRS